MRFFLDTEFMEEPGFLQLLSIGLVTQDGWEYYAVNADADRSRANPWVRANVLPHLQAGGAFDASLETIAQNIAAMVSRYSRGVQPIFWGYFSDYDWVCFCWLFGTMMDLPKGWPNYCLDLRQLMDHYGVSRADLPPEGPHNALEDAKWIRESWLQIRAAQMPKSGLLRSAAE